MSLRRHDEEELALEHLAAAGFEVHELSSAPVDAIPILLRELDEPYGAMTLYMIAQAIDRKAARPYWDELVARYRHGSPPPPEENQKYGLLTGLAILISRIATKADVAELIELAGDDDSPRTSPSSSVGNHQVRDLCDAWLTSLSART